MRLNTTSECQVQAPARAQRGARQAAKVPVMNSDNIPNCLLDMLKDTGTETQEDVKNAVCSKDKVRSKADP